MGFFGKIGNFIDKTVNRVIDFIMPDIVKKPKDIIPKGIIPKGIIPEVIKQIKDIIPKGIIPKKIIPKEIILPPPPPPPQPDDYVYFEIVSKVGDFEELREDIYSTGIADMTNSELKYFIRSFKPIKSKVYYSFHVFLGTEKGLKAHMRIREIENQGSYIMMEIFPIKDEREILEYLGVLIYELGDYLGDWKGTLSHSRHMTESKSYRKLIGEIL